MELQDFVGEIPETKLESLAQGFVKLMEKIEKHESLSAKEKALHVFTFFSGAGCALNLAAQPLLGQKVTPATNAAFARVMLDLKIFLSIAEKVKREATEELERERKEATVQ